MSQFVTTTPLHAMRPLGSPAERSLPRLEAILQREFKGRLSFALAEPVERKDGAGIDWYTDLDDPVTPLAGLPEPLADYYRSRLQSDKAIVSAVIQQYEERADPAARTMATALRNAISYPGEENLWLVGDTQSGQAKILLTAWGYEPRTPERTGRPDIGTRDFFPPSGGVEIDTTSAQQAAEETSTTSVPPKPQRQRNWRSGLFYGLWLLALILPFIIGWMLLPACGIRVPFTDRIIYGFGDGAYCRQVANPEAERGQRETQGLMAEMRRLEDALRDLLALCVPPPPPRPPVAPPVQQPPPIDQNRIEREGQTLNSEEDSITLTWNGTNDLDLFLVCVGTPPGGTTRIGRGDAGCGAKSSIDLNTSSTISSEPVEYIKWPRGALKPGRYRVEVMYFTQRNPSPVKTPYTVTVRRNGVPQVFRMETSNRVPGENKESQTVTEFTAP